MKAPVIGRVAHQQHSLPAGRPRPFQAVGDDQRFQATEAVRVSDKVQPQSIAPLLGEAIRRISDETSVSSLFD